MTTNVKTLITSLTLLLFSVFGQAFAADTGRYLTKENVTTQSGETVPVGTDIQILGIIEVSKEISPSGRLATFNYQGRIFNADAAKFAKVDSIANFTASPLKARDDGNTAALCTTLIPSDQDDVLNLSESNLEQFVQVFQSAELVSNYAVQKPKNALGYYAKETDFCISGLAYSTNYKLTLLEGLPARTKIGNLVTLDKPLTFFAQTPDKTPAIHVSAAQNILPMRDEAVIPFTATNVTKMSVEVFRVDPRSLTNSYDVFKILDGYGIDRIENFLSDKIGTQTLSLDIPKNATKNYNINLTSLLKNEPAGLYVAVFQSNDLELSKYQKRPTQWFMRSDVAISIYSGLNHSDIYLSHFATTDAVSNADITLIARNNKILAQGTSDKTGRLRLNRQLLNGTGGHAPEYLLVNGADDSITILPLENLDTKPRQLRRGLKKGGREDIYLTSEREMYRAGDIIHVMAAAKDRALNPLPNQEFILQLKRADGTEISRQIVKSDNNGALAAEFALKSTARLGQYEIHLSAMDERRLAAHTIRVEDFVPLTIDPSLTPTKSDWKNGKSATVTLSAEYFSGGPANGLQGEIVAQLAPLRHHEKEELKDFVFGAEETKKILKTDYFSGLSLNAKGLVSVTLPNQYDLPEPGLYQVRLTGRVFDVGGRPNATQLNIPLETDFKYVGIRSLFGKELDEGTAPNFEVINIDRAGTEKSFEDIQYSLAKITYSFDSYYDNGWRWRKSRLQDTVVETGQVTSRNLALKTPLDWGSYEITVTNSQGMKTRSSFYAGWGGDQSPTTEPEALSLSLQRSDADTATVRFTAPFAGKLRLMTASTDIESSLEIQVEKGEVEAEIQLPSNIEPGVHLLATLIRPITENSEHLPQFAVGSVWSPHLAAGRVISTDLIAPEKARSKDALPVTVSLDQEAASAMLFLVDEGIHGLTGFQNVDLADHFYQERQLGLGLITNFGRLIRQDRSLQTFRVGGDGDLASSANRQQSDFFRTVASASPLLQVVDGKVSHTFPATEFEGRLRLVALVVSKTGVGYAEKSITLQDPVSLDISLPRFVGVGDKVEGRLALRGNEESHEVTLTRKIGGHTQTISQNLAEGDRVESPLLLSSAGAGRLPVIIENTIAGQTTTRSFDLTARFPSYPVVELYTVPLNKAGAGQESLTRIPPLISNAFSLAEDGYVKASLNLSPIAGAGLGAALSGLDRYPYGCVEQVSSATRGLLARVKYSGREEGLITKINHGIDQIIAKQKNSGAFGYWDRSSDIYSEYQPYAVQTLIMAREFARDQKSVEEAINKGLGYLYGQNPRNVKTRLYAYGLLIDRGFEVTSRARYAIDHQLNIKKLTYSRQGKKYPHIRERLERLSLAYWVAAKLHDRYRLAQLEDQFNTTLALIPEKTTANQTVAKWAKPSSFLNHESWLSSGSAPEFGYLLTQIPANYKMPSTETLISNTLRDLSAQRYRATDMNAKLADLHLYQKSNLAGTSITIDGDPQVINKDGEVPVSLTQLRRGIDIRHNLGRPLTLNAELVGLRDTVDPVDNGFRVRKFWTDKEGNPVPLKNGSLIAQQGDLFSITLEIIPSRVHRQDDLLLTDLLPSGFEIEDAILPQPTKLLEGGKLRKLVTNRKRKYPSYQQNMDDRFMAHFKGQWNRNDIAYVTYVVRAAYPGKMSIPDAHVEFMYAPAINGRSAVNRAKIEKGS